MKKTISARLSEENTQFLRNQKSISDTIEYLVTRERLKKLNMNPEEILKKEKIEKLIIERKELENQLEEIAKKIRFINFELSEIVEKNEPKN